MYAVPFPTLPTPHLIPFQIRVPYPSFFPVTPATWKLSTGFCKSEIDWESAELESTPPLPDPPELLPPELQIFPVPKQVGQS